MTPRAVWRPWLIMRVVLTLALVAGCRVVDTTPLISDHAQSCRGALGSYFLPKSLIGLKITQKDEQAFQIVVSEPTADADRGQAYCLDYLGSALADDTVSVIRDPSLGVLQKIASINDDKSKDVALTALQIGLIAATGNPNVMRKVRVNVDSDASRTILADFQVDPFDRMKLAEINAAMAGTYGYCAVIDGYTVTEGEIQAYCNAPLSFGRYSKVPENALALVRLDEANRGILYRPNQTHQLIVFRRRDPQARDRWQIFQTKRIDMPNISPIFSVGVERSAFVARKTTLMFENGVLRDVTIEKPSEALSFVEIPLRVVQAVVQVPAEIIKVRIAAINNEKEIIAAQAGLIQTQRATAEAAANLRGTGSLAGTDTNRSLQKRDSRLNFTGSTPQVNPPGDCEFLCSGTADPASCRC